MQTHHLAAFIRRREIRSLVSERKISTWVFGHNCWMRGLFIQQKSNIFTTRSHIESDWWKPNASDSEAQITFERRLKPESSSCLRTDGRLSATRLLVSQSKSRFQVRLVYRIERQPCGFERAFDSSPDKESEFRNGKIAISERFEKLLFGDSPWLLIRRLLI